MTILGLRKALLLSTILISTACVNQPVEPDQRDSSGRFQGFWVGNLALTKEVQVFNKYIYSCSKYQHPLFLKVEDGYLTGLVGEEGSLGGFRTPVDETGYFYAVIETDHKYREGDDVPFGSSTSVNILIKGQLNAGENAGEGTLVMAQKASTHGCTADFTVSREN